MIIIEKDHELKGDCGGAYTTMIARKKWKWQNNITLLKSQNKK